MTEQEGNARWSVTYFNCGIEAVQEVFSREGTTCKGTVNNTESKEDTGSDCSSINPKFISEDELIVN